MAAAGVLVQGMPSLYGCACCRIFWVASPQEPIYERQIFLRNPYSLLPVCKAPGITSRPSLPDPSVTAQPRDDAVQASSIDAKAACMRATAGPSSCCARARRAAACRARGCRCGRPA